MEVIKVLVSFLVHFITMHRCISPERHELPNDAPVVPIDWNLGGRLYRVTASNAVYRRPCVLKKIFRVDPERRQQHGCNEKRLLCVSALIIFHAAYTVARNSVGVFDMAEREEPPNDVPCGANCLKSVLGHACIHCLDTIYHKVIGRNSVSPPSTAGSLVSAGTQEDLHHPCP
jgi:hypothetical protein